MLLKNLFISVRDPSCAFDPTALGRLNCISKSRFAPSNCAWRCVSWNLISSCLWVVSMAFRIKHWKHTTPQKMNMSLKRDHFKRKGLSSNLKRNHFNRKGLSSKHHFSGGYVSFGGVWDLQLQCEKNPEMNVNSWYPCLFDKAWTCIVSLQWN